LNHDEDLIVLDVKGKEISTEKIADRFTEWQMQGRRVCVVIGGPDGLHQSVLSRAVEQWSFGRITLPHTLVRVILAEQLYRAWSLQRGHPYHRAN
jgi:23S rRNA (pseudouridine1915-N3)-methyltransferase